MNKYHSKTTYSAINLGNVNKISHETDKPNHAVSAWVTYPKLSVAKIVGFPSTGASCDSKHVNVETK